MVPWKAGEASFIGRFDEVLELERAILDTRATIAWRRRELAHAVYFLYYALGIDGPEGAVTAPAP